jgi:hypothetical protein
MPLGDIALISFLLAITPFGLSLTWNSDRPYYEIAERRGRMKRNHLGFTMWSDPINGLDNITLVIVGITGVLVLLGAGAFVGHFFWK